MADGPVTAIVNPAAGGGRGPARWERVARILAAAGRVTSTLYTEKRGDGIRLAAQAAEGNPAVIVAVGGDGTVNEVINGIMRPAGGTGATPIAVIPAGTGMDIARNARIPRRAEEIAEVILRHRMVKVDIGVATVAAISRNGGEVAGGSEGGQFFVNFAEIGLGAAVVAHESRYSEHWPGRLSFLLAAVTAGLQETNLAAVVQVDGETVYAGDLVSVVVANGSYFGGGMRIAPGASMTDGELDVIILGDFSRAQLVSQIWKIYPGMHTTHPKVRCLRGRQIVVEPLGAARLDLDGELHGGAATYRLSVLPGALSVLS